MPHSRLIPLLAVGAAGLAFTGCGNDRDATPVTQAAVPTEASAAPADGGSAATPTTTTAAPASGHGADAATSRAPATPSEDLRTTDGPASRAPGPAPTTDAAEPSRTRPQRPSPESANGRNASPPKALKVLRDYVKGGAPASDAEATTIRNALLGFRDALSAQDAAKACSYTYGLPAESTPDAPAISCDSLVTGSKMAPPTQQDREMIRAAKIVVSDDKATVELGGGLPMPLRRVDGRWRVDYGTVLGLQASAG